MADSAEKRQRERKKREKRREKAWRKEQRKAGLLGGDAELTEGAEGERPDGEGPPAGEASSEGTPPAGEPRAEAAPAPLDRGAPSLRTEGEPRPTEG